MLRLSRLTDYSVVILEVMSRLEGGNNEECNSAATLARAGNLPEPTVSKILKLLSRRGIVGAQRGASGGYSLVVPLSQLSLLRVIEAIEGPLVLTDCVETPVHLGKGACVLENACGMNGRWTMVNNAVESALDNITIAAMVTPRCASHNKAVGAGGVHV